MDYTSGAAYDVPIVPVRYARKFIHFVESKGVSQRALLRDSLIGVDTLDNPDAFLSMNQVLNLLSQADWLMEDERAPFEFGQQLDLPAHGLTGFAMLGQQDYHDLINAIVQHLQVSLPLLSMRLHTDKNTVCIRLADNWNLGDTRSFMVKIFMGSIHSLATQVCRQMVFEFDFPTQAGARADLWQDFIAETEFQFESRFNQVTLHLSEPLSRQQAPNIAYQLARAHTASELSSPEGTDLTTRVRARLIEHPGRNASLPQAAQELGMSERSLRKHLADAGTSYRKIRTEVRQTFATRFLKETSLSLEFIAEKLGFSDQASFTRAYRAWTGQTPGDVRRQGADSDQSLGGPHPPKS